MNGSVLVAPERRYPSHTYIPFLEPGLFPLPGPLPLSRALPRSPGCVHDDGTMRRYDEKRNAKGLR